MVDGIVLFVVMNMWERQSLTGLFIFMSALSGFFLYCQLAYDVYHFVPAGVRGGPSAGAAGIATGLF